MPKGEDRISMYDFKSDKKHSHGSSIGWLFILPFAFLSVPIIRLLSEKFDYNSIVDIILIPTGFILFVIFLSQAIIEYKKCQKCQSFGLRKMFFAGGTMSE